MSFVFSFISILGAALAMISQHSSLVLPARFEVAVVVGLAKVTEVLAAFTHIPSGLGFPVFRFRVHLHLVSVSGFRIGMGLGAVLALKRLISD